METINLEKAYDRLEELYRFLNHFPDSPLAPIFRNEIAFLEKEIAKNVP